MEHSEPKVRSRRDDVAECVSASRRAASDIEDVDQQAVDNAVEAIAWALCRGERPRELAELTIDETGRGNLEDKVEKTEQILRATLEDLRGEPSVGVIDRDEEQGVVEIAKPVGVVGALVPSTNSIGTPAFLAMIAVKGRNALVLSPSPSATETCDRVVGYVRAALEACGFPRDLVQTLPRPITKERAFTLMDEVDVVQVTGSKANVRAGQESGTPNYCVGEGNTVALVDSSADLELAARTIEHAVTYDNGLVCLSVSNVLVSRDVREKLVDALEAVGGYVCTESETAALRETLFADGGIRTPVVGKSARQIASDADLSQDAREASFLLAPIDTVGENEMLSGEKLSPTASLYEFEDFEDALEVTDRILRYEGRGHSCVLYTEDERRAVEVGDRVDVCRLGVNHSSVALAGGFENGARATFALGGGTWAGNQLDENLTYEHFIDTTRVFHPVDDEPPADEDLFGTTTDA